MRVGLLSIKISLNNIELQRIQPLIEDVTPINQAGFQHQLKTGAVFIDQTAALI
jgi:hypothetical protein